eukprot:TRINITY_DN39416_c0_g1_i1.p1 TRINITY_DN39416_c0_g1~~TRINITY_DN39416_c0_g1_i1.p1  ORF type:complete len:198 (-),score=42.22 TRINITY_DN39416_c0_g1_i1:269-790(-)
MLRSLVGSEMCIRDSPGFTPKGRSCPSVPAHSSPSRPIPAAAAAPYHSPQQSHVPAPSKMTAASFLSGVHSIATATSSSYRLPPQPSYDPSPHQPVRQHTAASFLSGGVRAQEPTQNPASRVPLTPHTTYYVSDSDQDEEDQIHSKRLSQLERHLQIQQTTPRQATLLLNNAK